MQTLWSRVAQVRATCRCPQCLNAANGVTRRATASATRRMPRYLYSSTLWYSGIFAAAATFDASRKERRKEQWDRVIAEVRQELEQPTSLKQSGAVESADVLEPVDNAYGDEIEEYQPFGDVLDEGEATPAPAFAQNGAAESNSSGLSDIEEDIFHLMGSPRHRPQYPTSTGPELETLDWAPQSIYASEQAKRVADLSRWSPKKLATVQKSIEILQLQIFQRLRAVEYVEEAAAAVPEEYAQHIRQSPESLNREFEIKFAQLYEIKQADSQLSKYHPKNSGEGQMLCRYTQDALGNFHDTAREVNRSMRKLFTQRRDDQISQGTLLAKLAYTLYISPAPPNLGTFNTLLIGLRHAKEDDLVKRVIITMNESHVRVNEVSFATKLEFYTERNDITNFVRTIERIRGKHGGPMLARPDSRIESESAKRKLIRMEVDGRNGLKTKVIQLPTPTPLVFGAIVNGVLKFAGFEAALSICEGMSKEGWGLCMAGLTPLLKDCADRGDWNSGMAVWKQIQMLKMKSDSRKRASEQVGIEAFAAMLRLCTNCDQRDTFDNVWRQASLSWKGSVEKLTRLIKGENGPKEAPPIENTPYQSAKTRRVTQPDTGVLPQVSENELDGKYWQSYASNPLDEQSEPEGELWVDHAESVLPVRTPPSDKRKAPSEPPTVLLEQQLFGLHSSHELDEYELRERPMSAAG